MSPSPSRQHRRCNAGTPGQFQLRQLCLLLIAVACSPCHADDVPWSPSHHHWSALRTIERALDAANKVSRGVGDALAFSAGGTLRAAGGVVKQLGSGLQLVEQAISGSGAEGDDQKRSGEFISASDATRRLLSRPVHVVSSAVRTAGDAIGLVGDTTERLAAEAFGLLPDTVRVLGSSVRELRVRMGDDGDVMPRDYRGGAVPMDARQGQSSSAAESADAAERGRLASSEYASTAAGSDAAAAPRLFERVRTLAATFLRLVRGSDGLTHIALALAAAMAGAPRLDMFGRLLLAALCACYLQMVDLQRSAVINAQAESASLRAMQLKLSPSIGSLTETATWLNAIIASGWSCTLIPYLEETVAQGISAALLELQPDLPRALHSVFLQQLSLGAEPPVLVSASACAFASPPFAGGSGAAASLQCEIDWFSPSAALALEIAMANVPSAPRLRVRKPRLQGLVRVHWEWLREYPYIGRVRFCFVEQPRLDLALEPLGTLNALEVPGVGRFIREAMRERLFSNCVYPAWVETDMRLSAQPMASEDSAKLLHAQADFLLNSLMRAKTPSRSERASAGHASLDVMQPTQPMLSSRSSENEYGVHAEFVPDSVKESRPVQVDQVEGRSEAGDESVASASSRSGNEASRGFRLTAVESVTSYTLDHHGRLREYRHSRGNAQRKD